MVERRSNMRIDALDEGLKVVNTIDGQPIGIVSNLSPEGMMLITSRQMFAGGILQLDIAPPASLHGNRISLGLKVLWCTPANSPDEYWAGLEIIDISPDGRRALQQLLTRLARSD